MKHHLTKQPMAGKCARFWRAAAALLVTVFSLSTALAAERFELRTSVINIPERGDVTSFLLLLDTNQVAFMPPPNWKVQTNPAEHSVTLSQNDGNAQLALYIHPEFAGRTNAPKQEELRALIDKRIPGSRIVEEIPCYTASGPGQGYLLDRPGAANAIKLTTRIAFVPWPIGLAEIVFVTPANAPPTILFGYNNFMATLQLEPLKAAETAPGQK